MTVVGKVGAGKSALLHSILGEMLKLEGSVSVSGSVSYASQSAFILNATVRENILFCSTYDQERYLSVVKGCCLVSDFQLLPEGDATEIGERCGPIDVEDAAAILMFCFCHILSCMWLTVAMPACVCPFEQGSEPLGRSAAETRAREGAVPTS